MTVVGRPTAQLLDVLAAAQATSGDFAVARKTAREALTLAAEKDKVLVPDLRARLTLYEAGRAYRQMP